MTKLPKCPKCGRVFSWRYYYIHVKKCKGKRKEKQKKLNGFLSEDSVKDSKKSKRKDKKRGKRKKRR